jgi:DNA-binding transcriptional MerR regulator
VPCPILLSKGGARRFHRMRIQGCRRQFQQHDSHENGSGSHLAIRMANHLPQRRSPQKPEIPDKLYFRIGEVARLCEVEPYVLRFWQSEFGQLRPNKSGTGQRLYRKRDVEMALRIKRLLHEEGYTIAGARQIVQAESRGKVNQSELPLDQRQTAEQTAVRLHKVRKELREILGMLSATPELQAAAVTKEKKPTRMPSRARDLFED